MDEMETLLSTGQIPIIDLGNSVKNIKPSNAVCTQLQLALSESGCAFLINHGISADDIYCAWSYLDKFCDFPPHITDTYTRDEYNHGYVKPGGERVTADITENRHTYNILHLDENSLPEKLLPGFRKNISTLNDDFKSLSTFILEAIAIGLGIDVKHFQNIHSRMMSGTRENITTFRLIYYPPIANGESTGNTTRCGEHCDYGTFTFLTQDSEGGLEVRLPGTECWKRVGHLPGAILINTAEILEILTAGRYPPLWHRVVIPEENSIRNRGRHSMAFFVVPDDKTMIQPLLPAALVEGKCEGDSKLWAPITTQDWIQEKFKIYYGNYNA